MNPTVEAVEKFLVENPESSGSPEAALALAAARAIDDERASVTSRSMVMGRYLDAMAVLRAMAPEKRQESVLDEIRARRDARRAAAEGGVGAARPAAS